MADNLALKLLIAGIIGAVVGAAAADRYRFPAGSVYGAVNRTAQEGYRVQPSSDPMTGPARGLVRLEEQPRVEWAPPPWPDWGPPGEPRWRAPRTPGRAALCWREYQDWDFGTTGHFVPCPPGRT
jgi:hypothetical protein